MSEWFQGVALTLVEWLAHGNPLVFGVLFLVAAVVEVGVPMPFIQESALLSIGFEPTGRLLYMAPLIMITLIAGRILGGSALFWLVRKFEGRFTRWLSRKFPKIMVKARDLGARLGKKSQLAVAAARLTPGLLTATTVASGLFDVKYRHFCLGIIFSSLITDGGEIAFGLAVNHGFTIAGVTPTPTHFMIVFVILMVMIGLVSWLWEKRKDRTTKENSNPN